MKYLITIFLSLTLFEMSAQNSTVTDEQIMQILSSARSYTLVLLIPGSKDEKSVSEAEMQKITMAHLRYLFTLKQEGKVPIFGPLTDGGKIHGIIFFTSDNKDDVKKLLDVDPLVKSGLVAYELHPYFGLPGDQLPR